MKYTVSLDSRELNKLARKLLNYADTFEDKVKIFLNRLADLSIKVASANGGDFSRFIIYSKKLEDGTTITVSASSKLIKSKWYAGSNSSEVRTEVISPILMAEFGSGYYAIPDKSGIGGQGTLNKYGHAYDPFGWYWYAEYPPIDNGEPVKTAQNGKVLYNSMGNEPTQPLHKAVMACIEQVTKIAKEVFG